MAKSKASDSQIRNSSNDQVTQRAKSAPRSSNWNQERESIGSLILKQTKHKSRLVSSYDELTASNELKKITSSRQVFKSEKSALSQSSKENVVNDQAVQREKSVLSSDNRKQKNTSSHQVFKSEKSALSQSSKENAVNDQSVQSEKSVLSSDNRKQLRILRILETYVIDHSLPQKVLTDQSFCRFMLRHGITKQAICDLLLSKDVELYITSCDTCVLIPPGMRNEEQQNDLVRLALCLTELSCGHLDSCLKAGECVESFVQNGNPSFYFVATKRKPFVKLLKLPGVAVISAKSGGNLILKEASSSQKTVAEKNTNESKKRKIEANVESERKGVSTSRRVNAKTESEKELVLNDEPQCRTLFMGNLNLSINEQDIHQFFGSGARIVEVRISNRMNENARFAHVQFATADDLEKALKLKGKDLLGRAVNLDYAEKKPFVLDLARTKFSGKLGKK